MATEKKSENKKRMIVRGFKAFKEEFDRWKAKAKARDRSLSWFVRQRMLECDAREENKDREVGQ